MSRLNDRWTPCSSNSKNGKRRKELRVDDCLTDDDDLLSPGDLDQLNGVDSSSIEWDEVNKKDNSVPKMKKVSKNQGDALVRAIPVKHPSWRVYKALGDLGFSVDSYGLQPVAVYYPTNKDDAVIDELKKLFTCVAEQKGNVLDFSTFEDSLGILEPFKAFLDSSNRNVIEDLLLTGSNLENIRGTVDCDENFLVMYQMAFYDTSVFKNPGDMATYLLRGATPKERDSKVLASQGGLSYVASKYGFRSAKDEAETMLRDAYCKAYFRLVTLADNEDLEAQEVAQGWGTLMTKLYSQMKDDGSSSDVHNYKIQLTQTHAPTVSMADLKNM